MLESLLKTPIRYKELKDPLFDEKGISVFMHLQGESEDPLLGNKGYKLLYNIQGARRSGKTQLLSFGGAYSNHLYALAYLGYELDIDTIGVVRGEQSYANNPTLTRVQSWGMKLHFIDRLDYRKRLESSFLRQWEKRYPEALIIPEGGSNGDGVAGCRSIPRHWEKYTGWNPDFWAVAAGTGATAAGIILGLEGAAKTLIFPALKGYKTNDLIQPYLPDKNSFDKDYRVLNDYHFGGFAKMPPSLARFIQNFEQIHQIRLDPIYTCRMMFGIYDLVKQDLFPRGCRILAYHSGGLQGWYGMQAVFNRALYMKA